MRWGITVPFNSVPLADHASLLRAVADSGYTDAWSAEAAGTDAFTPLALASVWAPELRLGTAIAPVYTRGPGLLAMSAAALAEAAPGRFALGIGASSPVIVEDWNDGTFARPYQRARDTLRFLRRALAGERVDEAYETFTVRRFRLERPPAVPPPLLLAALRPGMLRLAGTEADGVVLNWLSAGDVARAVAELAAPSAFEVVARIFVCPTEDVGFVRTLGRRMIASYLTVPAYAAFHRWLGREADLGPMWQAWAAGDRRQANEVIPDHVLDALIVHGDAARCRAGVEAYRTAGVTTPVLAILPTPEITSGGVAALERTLRALAPVG